MNRFPSLNLFRTSASPSPHPATQPHVIERYGRTEYVGAVGTGGADGVDVDDVFGVCDGGGEQVAHASQGVGVEAQLENGFLDAVAPGFQYFRDAEPSPVVGYVVGDDVDHRHAIPCHR